MFPGGAVDPEDWDDVDVGLDPAENRGLDLCDDSAANCPVQDLSFRDIIIATPGEPNAGGELYPLPAEDFREPK